MDDKINGDFIVSDANDNDLEMRSKSKLAGTDADQLEMRAMGKTQQLNRNFRFISILGFSCTAMSTWEIVLSSTLFGLINGGTAGLIWSYLIVWAGYMFVFASIAEMASIAPTAGGQYHWVSEFAPRSAQKFLSYMVGWISTLGWQTGLASIAFIVGTVIQGLVVLNNADYVFERWHGTLLVIAIISFAVIFNTFLAHRLPMVEGIILVVHLLGFLAVLIPLWVLAPRGSAEDVFTTFENLGGWATQGTSVMIGMLSSVYALLGADSAVHMSEEVRDASIVLPRATMWAIVVNGSFGFIMMITFCFTLGDPFAAIGSLTGYPFIQVFYSGTGSLAGASVMVAIMVVTITSSVISTLATVSRQSWSFARDGGLPFAGFIGHVKPGWNIPLNAVLLTWLITCLLSLINIGSTTAFNAISSSATVSLLSTYIISITCLVIKRLRGEPLSPHRWTLGKAGLFINLAALAFLFTIWVFLFFPITSTVDAATMNWNSLIYGGTILFAVIYYFVVGRKNYIPPVALVTREHVM